MDKTIIESSDQVEIVSSVDELLLARFSPANCILLPRNLSGDFNSLAKSLADKFKLTSEDRHHLRFFAADSDGLFPNLRDITSEFQGEERIALDQIINDLDFILTQVKHYDDKFAFLPELRLIGPGGYQDKEVQAFHHDVGDEDTNDSDNKTKHKIGRLCCCYNEPVTEVLLKGDFTANANPSNDPFKNSYSQVEGSEIVRFKPGDLWRQTFNGTVKGLEPFVHRGPIGSPFRLMMATQLEDKRLIKEKDLNRVWRPIL